MGLSPPWKVSGGLDDDEVVDVVVQGAEADLEEVELGVDHEEVVDLAAGVGRAGAGLEDGEAVGGAEATRLAGVVVLAEGMAGGQGEVDGGEPKLEVGVGDAMRAEDAIAEEEEPDEADQGEEAHEHLGDHGERAGCCRRAQLEKGEFIKYRGSLPTLG